MKYKKILWTFAVNYGTNTIIALSTVNDTGSSKRAPRIDPPYRLSMDFMKHRFQRIVGSGKHKYV